MTIALDAMGGDYAPLEVVKGAVAAAREYGVEIALVGKRSALEAELVKYNPRSGLTIVDAAEVIGMSDPPAIAIRQKKDSSLMVAMNLVKRGEASAFVSAGNSGAVMAAALLVLGREEGIERPAISVAFQAPSGPVLFLDVGANPDCKPSFLVQFAHMGSAYMQRAFNIAHPRVGLLSNGEEETKGNQLVREAHHLLKQSNLNFVGNVEGKDVSKGVADVVVTDGFTGNVITKVTEGVGEMLADLLKQALMSRLHLKVVAFLLKAPIRSVVERVVDYTEYGGAILLGVRGDVIIAHGRSDARAIKSSIRLAKQTVDQGGL